jgi:hypothetical protein
MTRKDFELIAEAIYTAPITERRAMAEHMAASLTVTNPRFNRERFISACMAPYSVSERA